jgi:endonuclease/exonuclease/phosphatase family metal-dependent hydrolase
MRLVSLNTWKCEGDYPQRVRAMAEGLVALSPDVVALQEDLRTRDGLTHTARSLATVLSMQMAWLPARAKPRLLNGQCTDTTSGLAVLSRQPVLEQGSVVLPADARDGERVAQWVRLAGAHADWWLVNLHLTHLPDRADLRRAQLETVLQALQRVAGEQPVVLCGDFNAALTDPEIASAMHPQGPLVDAFSGQAKVTHRGSSVTGYNLDHILLRAVRGQPPFSVAHARVVLDGPDAHGVWPSDHFAVCANLV